MTATSQELEAEVDRLAGHLRLPYLRRAAAEAIPTGRSQRFRPRAKCCAWCWPRKPPAATRPASPTGAAGPAFPPAETFDSWDTDASSVPTATEQAQGSLEWIGRAENLAVVGPSGTGKSHLLEALGHAAVDDRLTVTWLEHPSFGRPRMPPPRRRQPRPNHPGGDPRRPDRHR